MITLSSVFNGTIYTVIRIHVFAYRSLNSFLRINLDITRVPATPKVEIIDEV